MSDRDPRSTSRRLRTPTALLGVVGILAVIGGVAGGCSGGDAAAGDSEPAEVGLSDAVERDGSAPTEPDDVQRGSDGEREPRPTPSDGGTAWDFGTVDGADASGRLELRAIVPPSGPVSGGNRVRVEGEGLSGDVELFFGGRRAEVSRSGGELVASVPAAESARMATVKAVGPNGRRRVLEDGYEYVAPIEVDRVSPTRLPTEGGTQVELRGRGFGPAIGVSLDRQPALRVDRVDDGLVRFIAPPGSAGAVDLRLTTPQTSVELEDALTYVRSLNIDSVVPAAGSTSGGETVVVEGSGFGGSATVSFGNRRAQVLSQRPDRLEVRTPAQSEGSVDVAVRSRGEATLAEDAYLYQASPTPTVSALAPVRGAASGGTDVRIVGRGFGGSNPTVQFGTTDARILEAKPTFVRAETPAGAPGSVDVEVRAGGQTVGRLVDGFEYVESPSVDTVSPASGPAAGGTKVTLEGSGFEGADRVTFGGLPAQFDVQSDDRIRAQSPAHTAGNVDVAVYRDEISARQRDAFTYETDVEIWGFDPIRGSIAGGTYVEVRGRGFIGSVSAQFDGTDAPEVRRVDRNSLYLYTPPHSPGAADLTVESDAGRTDGPYSFDYFNPASREGGASGGSIEGAVNVTVLADGGGPIEGAFVMLSTRADTPHTGTTDTDGQVTLSGPQVQGAQTVTATAQGYTSTTLRHIDAENLTLFLSKTSPSDGDGGGNGDDPPRAKVEGTVRAPVKFGNPDDKVSWEMAMVGTTMENVSGRRVDPGPDAVVPTGGQYEIESRIGDIAVVALCGMYSPEDEEFKPTYMGVKPYLSVADGKSYRADIVCDIPLDRSLDVKLQNPVYAPGGPNVNRAEVYWDFGFSGVFPSPVSGVGQGSQLEVPRQPPLEGDLSGVELIVVAGSFTGQRSPSTQMRVSGVTGYGRPVLMPELIDVPEPLEPRPGGSVEDGRIRFQAATPPVPDLYSVYLLNDRGRPFWRYLMPGDARSIQLPSFPDFSYLPRDQRPDPWSADAGNILIFAVEGDNVSFQNFSYRDLSFSRWRGYAMTRWGLEFPTSK